MVTILSIIYETLGRRTLNSELVQDMDEGNACMKFEQNPLKKKKVIEGQRISRLSIHFVCHLGNCELQDPRLIQDNNESDACMKFEQNPLKRRKLLCIKITDRQSKIYKASARLYQTTSTFKCLCCIVSCLRYYDKRDIIKCQNYLHDAIINNNTSNTSKTAFINTNAPETPIF